MLKKILLLALFVAPLSLFAQKYAQFDYAGLQNSTDRTARHAR